MLMPHSNYPFLERLRAISAKFSPSDNSLGQQPRSLCIFFTALSSVHVLAGHLPPCYSSSPKNKDIIQPVRAGALQVQLWAISCATAALNLTQMRVRCCSVRNIECGDGTSSGCEMWLSVCAEASGLEHKRADVCRRQVLECNVYG